jgi:hypothetical protein
MVLSLIFSTSLFLSRPSSVPFPPPIDGFYGIDGTWLLYVEPTVNCVHNEQVKARFLRKWLLLWLLAKTWACDTVLVS